MTRREEDNLWRLLHHAQLKNDPMIAAYGDKRREEEIEWAWDDYQYEWEYWLLHPHMENVQEAWEIWEAEERYMYALLRLGQFATREIDLANMRLDIAQEAKAIQEEHDLAVDIASAPESTTDTHTVTHVRSTAFRRASRDRYVSKAVKRGIDPKRADYMATCSCFLCKWDKKMNVPTIKEKMVALELAEGLNQ